VPRRAIGIALRRAGDFGARSTVTGSQSNPRDASLAAVTTPAGLGGACARCGATVATGSTTCQRCGATITGANPAEQAERIRLRLQESIGDAYRLVELLGRGGMGIVFRAHELALDREVALKVLALDPILSSEAYARFEREAKLAARLDHPNVVPIFAVGQRNTVAYYTMRLVRGGTLEEMLTGHRALDFNHALEILRDVASALDYAHGQGVVHRDIKPANVLIADSGHAMVSDFGIARGLGIGDAAMGSGTVIGSPGYMSPEQWRGDEIDARGDQYALAVMAFELLTGHRPFETVRVQDLMKLHLSGEPPNASSLKATLPPFVDLSIRRAMSKSPSHRFTSATAFIDALSGKRPVSGMTRTSIPAVREAESTSAGFGGVAKALLTVGIIAAAAAGITIALQHELPGRTLRGRIATVALPAASGPTIPDSTLAVDTTFDVNAAASATTPAEPVRRPVAVDPTLFPLRSSAPSGDAPGYIRILARGGAAKVRVDGRTYGFSPQVVRVDPGAHVVSLEGSGDAFLPAQITVTAAPYDTLAAVFTARTPRGGSDSVILPSRDAQPASAAPPAASSIPAPASARPATAAPAPSATTPSDDATSLPSSVPPAGSLPDPAPAPPPATTP
jgi:hypothetical protein